MKFKTHYLKLDEAGSEGTPAGAGGVGVGDAGGTGAPPADPVVDPVAASTEQEPTSSSDWREALSQEYRDNPTLADVKDLDSLAKMTLDLKSYQGNSLRIPSEDASDADREAFRQKLIDKNIGLMEIPDSENPESLEAVYRALGKPESADAYELPEVEGLSIDDNRSAFLKETALKVGVNKTQFKTMMQEVLAADAAQAQAQTAEHEGKLRALNEEWGMAYDKKVGLATSVAEKFGFPEEFVTAIGEGKMNTDVLRALDAIAAATGTEAAQVASQEGGADYITPAEARERAAEIRNKLMDMNQNDPQYKDLVQKRVKYMQMANGK